MSDTNCETQLRTAGSELNRRIIPKNMSTGHGETILVVDDDVAILNLVRDCLQRLGYVVLTADRPFEAIRLAEKHIQKIRLVITDVIMPEMNGRELTIRLMSLKPDLKHLFMSGYTADVIGDRGVMEGGGSFIQKPFTMKALAAKVCEMLTEKKVEDNSPSKGHIRPFFMCFSEKTSLIT
jgi:CheY-like chemotaxis protein